MKKNKWEESVVCEKCKYYNKKRFIEKYGTCNLCGNVLDPKAKYKYEMVKRLRLWRNKKGG